MIGTPTINSIAIFETLAAMKRIGRNIFPHEDLSLALPDHRSRSVRKWERIEGKLFGAHSYSLEQKKGRWHCKSKHFMIRSIRRFSEVNREISPAIKPA